MHILQVIVQKEHLAKEKAITIWWLPFFLYVIITLNNMGDGDMAESSYVTENEFNLATKRIDEENKRQNERLQSLETNYAIVNQLSIHMERLASNMESMAKELARQGTKLNDLEMKPAKRWDLIITSIITGLVGAFIGMMLKGWTL